MPKQKIIYLLILLLLLQQTGLSLASWSLQGQIWSSPYHDQTLYLSVLSHTFQLQPNWQATIGVPVQLAIGTPEPNQLRCLYPRLSLAWSAPFNNVLSSNIRLDYDLDLKKLKVKGGVHAVFDPLALQIAALFEGTTPGLESSLVFAVTEKWALGTHLTYAKNSLLTYSLHHQTTTGGHHQFSYSHSLDGSMQSIGFRLVF